jgi:pimeloyl-ACP methyl ester carboxylesterase
MTMRALTLRDGRQLVVHDASDDDRGAPALLWHHGSPQTGALLQPLVEAATARGFRLISYARPSYGGSSPRPRRTVASAAEDVEQALGALGVDRFATMGASGGGPHALACAALLPDRVIGAVTLASPAPYTGDDEWFAGMVAPGALRSALQGREARADYARTDEFDPDVFTATDWAALEDRWASLGQDAGLAAAAGADGLIDDDVAFAAPWGFDLAVITVPVLIVQGGQDRMIPAMHGRWLAHRIPASELWLRPADGHVSILDACGAAMDWLQALA